MAKHPPLIIECALVDADKLEEELEKAVAEATDKDTEVSNDTGIGRETIRGADANTIAQFVVEVSVHVDVAKVLLYLGGTLAAIRATVAYGNRRKAIKKEDDAVRLIEDMRDGSSLGKVPGDQSFQVNSVKDTFRE